MMKKYLVRRGWSGNCGLFHARNLQGYTNDVHKAERFTLEWARAMVEHNGGGEVLHEDQVMPSTVLCYIKRGGA